MTGTYIAVKYSLLSCLELSKLQKKLQIPKNKRINISDFHSTLIFSKDKELDSFLSNGSLSIIVDSSVGILRYLGKNNEHLVVEIKSTYLNVRHKFIKDSLGGNHKYSDYIPHISLAYDLSEEEKKKLKINDGDLVNFQIPLFIISEYIENLK